MSMAKSKTRPLVLYLANLSVSQDLQSLDFLSEIEAKYPVTCTVLELDSKASSDLEAERERTVKCVATLKEAIQQQSSSSIKKSVAPIIIITSYPSTVHDLKCIVHIEGEPYPLLDGVIRFRLDAPPSEDAVAVDPSEKAKRPDDMSAADFEAIDSLSEYDVKDLLAENTEREAGMWADVTFDEIDVTGIPNQPEDSAQRRDALVELLGDCFSRRSKEKAGYRAWALLTRKFKVPEDKQATARARAAAAQYANSVLPFQSSDIFPVLGFPLINAECIWKTDLKLSCYLNTVNALPVAAQTPAGVLFSVCKAVVTTVAEEHLAATKSTIATYRKLRGGGANVEWQWTSGPFLGPPSTAFDASYQHRVLAQGGVGTRGLISFPPLSALAENKMQRDEQDTFRRLLTSNPMAESGSSEFPAEGENAFEKEPIAVGEMDGIESVMSMVCDVQDDTFSSLVRDLLPIPKSVILQDGCPVVVQSQEDPLVNGYSSSILSGDDFIVEDVDDFHLRQAKLLVALKTKPDSLLKDLAIFEKRAVLFGKVAQLLGLQGSEKLLPLYPTLSVQERSIQESELLTFSSLSANDLHRFRQALILDEIVNKHMPVLANFSKRSMAEMGGDSSATKRQFYRNHSALALQQLLCKYALMEPTISKQYYPLSDTLSIALMWTPPSRRMGRTLWDPTFNMRSRPSFREYEMMLRASQTEQAIRDAQSVDGENSVASKQASINASKSIASLVTTTSLPADESCDPLNTCIDAPRSELAKFQCETTVITPAGKSLVFLRSLLSTGDKWLSIYDKAYILGLRRLNSGDGRQKPCFTCQSDDGTRLVVTSLDVGEERSTLKPDGRGIICVSASFENGLTCSMGSNGAIRLHSTVCGRLSRQSMMRAGEAKGTDLYFIGDEKLRYVLSGVVIRHLANGPFLKDILRPDGTRVIIRSAPEPIKVTLPESAKKKNTKKSSVVEPPVIQQTTQEKYPYLSSFFCSLIDIPEWTQVELGKNGNFLFRKPDGSILDQPITSPENTTTFCTNCISSESVDGESGARLRYFVDGRMIVNYTDGLLAVYFPEGTKMLTNPTGGCLFIENLVCAHPSIEVDLEIESMCCGHARGETVPISKGGERVRARLNLPDGTVALLKYDTRVTSLFNGSVKLVRQDKSTVIAEDGGIVHFKSASAWTQEAKKELMKEIADNYPYDGLTKRRVLSAPAGSLTGRINSPTLTTNTNGGNFSPKGGNKIIGRIYVKLVSVTGVDSLKQNCEMSFTIGKKSKTSKPIGPSASMNINETVKIAWNGCDPLMCKLYEEGNADGVIGSLSIALADFDFSNKSIMILTDQLLEPPRNKFISLEISFSEQEGCTYKFTGQITNRLPTMEHKPHGATSFQFNVGEGNCSCKIVDFEHNSFDVDLAVTPASVKMELAGELEGLKPSAISENPIDPRLFVMKRSGDAVELICADEYHDLQTSLENSPEDVQKSSLTVASASSDLGGSVEHSFFIRRRTGSDIYAFDDLFPKRDWHHAVVPSNAAIVLRERLSSAYPFVGATDALRKLYKKVCIYEGMPLSEKGYENLRSDCKRWLDWRNMRNTSDVSFVVDDLRSPEEIQMEMDIAKEIKKLYKTIKANNKRRLKEAQAAAAALSASQAVADSITSIVDADDEVSDSDDENKKKDLPPLEKELIDAFHSYAVKHKIDRESLRPAFIQVMNETIDAAIIDQCVDNLEIFEPTKSTQSLQSVNSHDNGFSLAQFKHLYKSVKERMSSVQGTRSTARVSKAEITLTSSQENIYWQSPEGSIALDALPSTDLPLPHREVDWSSSIIVDSECNEESGSTSVVVVDYPAGSALGAARKKYGR